MTARLGIQAAGLAVALLAAAQTAAPPIAVSFLSYADVQTLPGVDALPALAGVPASDRPAAWDAWVRRRAEDVQARLLRGEEDSLAYLLVFGTSYTAAPRVTREFLERSAGNTGSRGASDPAPPPALQQAFDQRLADLLRALAAPGSDERLSSAAATLARLGHRLDSTEGRAKAAEYLLRNLSRVLRESTELSQALAAAGSAGDRDAELAQRARLFAQRGLAPDTAWPINFALSEALQQLKSASLLAAGGVRRVAIVGPGLDFVDKGEGHDYYPLQSLQPFAVVDALLASGLAAPGQPTVVTFDVSARVNAHLSRVVAQAGRQPYDLQLVRDRRTDWTPGASRYWTAFGARVGTEVKPIASPPSAGLLESRAVQLFPDVIRRISPVEANIVYQRIDPRAGERFDLVIATNILLYYDAFEQMLAARNIARLLVPGGLFLTNTRLDDVPAMPMARVASSATAFSSRPGDGEYIYAYGTAR
jgi:SAM-dependent methyltransferase